MPSEPPKGVSTAGAKRWFEPGYNGSSFKTTAKGVFIYTSTSTLPKHARVEELFAAAFGGRSAEGAGPSRFTEEEDDTHWTKRGAGMGKGEKSQSGGTYSYARMREDAKNKEPEERNTASEEPAPPASIDGLPEDEICIVCCNAPKECVFVPCGHHATCMACGKLVQEQAGKGCPVCRRPIERVLRIYEA